MSTKQQPATLLPCWRPSMTGGLFNENALKYEVARLWGEPGAHSEILGMMRKRSDAYQKLVECQKTVLAAIDKVDNALQEMNQHALATILRGEMFAIQTLLRDFGEL